MQIEPDKRWTTKEEKVNKDVLGLLLMVSLKLLLSSVMMNSKRDRILTACRTEGYFHGGHSEDPEAGTKQHNQPCLAQGTITHL